MPWASARRDSSTTSQQGRAVHRDIVAQARRGRHGELRAEVVGERLVGSADETATSRSSVTTATFPASSSSIRGCPSKRLTTSIRPTASSSTAARNLRGLFSEELATIERRAARSPTSSSRDPRSHLPGRRRWTAAAMDARDPTSTWLHIVSQLFTLLSPPEQTGSPMITSTEAPVVTIAPGRVRGCGRGYAGDPAPRPHSSASVRAGAGRRPALRAPVARSRGTTSATRLVRRDRAARRPGITLIPSRRCRRATLNVNVFTAGAGGRMPRSRPRLHPRRRLHRRVAARAHWYDAAAFNRDGVVTVTISYRLGFDGFGTSRARPPTGRARLARGARVGARQRLRVRPATRRA
jgi:hypothetical protein